MFLTIINTYSINLVLGTNRLQELIQMTRMSNHQRQTVAPVHFLFWCVPFTVLTARTRSLWSALGLQNEMLTSTQMRYSRKLALAADRQAGTNRQGSTCRPASSLPWHIHAQCPRQPVAPEGRKKTPQRPGNLWSSSNCLLGASCLIVLVKGQVQYSADDKTQIYPQCLKLCFQRLLPSGPDSLCPWALCLHVSE